MVFTVFSRISLRFPEIMDVLKSYRNPTVTLPQPYRNPILCTVFTGFF